jgi:hypothetical protein
MVFFVTLVICFSHKIQEALVPEFSDFHRIRSIGLYITLNPKPFLPSIRFTTLALSSSSSRF